MMAIPHAQPGEVVDVRPLGAAIARFTGVLLRQGEFARERTPINTRVPSTPMRR